ncbi:peptidoglycan D,D-transpeptidase FtsI family protein [Neobacillus cucumis]|uniref:peptidoglycan D,D-transpeptidase FtsI family protein n=1 Tax=Neobacillus cucumis TaxID=1740721 RepID=UPI001963E20C|nr:penicillin-binding protein 2 [Neobacillus cucumis]MBM7651645.1 cell division protein FtsI/penicillin-binding protein 2 [Neobacillus cucumis]
MKKTHVPFRLNMVFFVVFVLFSILILRLGELQIVFGDDFKRELQRTADVTVNNPVPRGKMYDRNGNTIVDNSPLNAITYTKSQNVTQKEMLDTAGKLAKLITMDTTKIPIRDKKDFWITQHPKEAKAKITKKEWAQYNQKKLDDTQIYQLELDRVTDQELNSFSKEELTTLAIYRQFNSGFALTPQIVKNKNVTPEEYAIVSENLENLPGVDTTTDWERKYDYGTTLKSILGDVTTSDQGIPKEQLDKYLAQGYSRNDRVGKSYLELKYEDVLHGQKAKVKSVTDKSGKVLSTETVSEGKRGDDLVLTIDMDLQQQVEKIIEEEMWSAKSKPNTGVMDRAFVVVMNPNTGEILSMAGKLIGKDKNGKTVMNDYASGTFTSSYNVGSAVKGATVLTGYQTGAIKPGSIQLDEPLKIKNTPIKKSWKTFGAINDLRALQVSSNVYMWKTVIAMAGGKYVPNGTLNMNTAKTFNTMRQSFAEFGLGTRTGIDLPNEMNGFQGTENNSPGKLMDLAIGQYDTYTPMQLAQYVSTIANGGNRIQPHIVKEIREPVMDSNTLGPIIEEIEPKVLNRIDMKDAWIKRVQEGFRMVMQVGDGTATSTFRSAPYSPAGKTGTAQAFYDGSVKSLHGTEVWNLSLVSYAPSTNPEVAIAVVVPWAYSGNSGPSINNLIGRRVLDAYFDLKKKRQLTEDVTGTEQPTTQTSTNTTQNSQQTGQ